jgi:ADP-ribose pyrophosphatase YjhB (NUDIX family)
LPTERPLVSVDLAILTVRDNALNVLLVRRPVDPSEPYPGQWALPGGFIRVGLDEDLEACARRKLREKTGIDSPYLEQVAAVGSATRDPRGWSVTHVYFALIPSEGLLLHAGANASAVEWHPLHGEHVGLPLAFDHASLLQQALVRLRAKVEYTSLPAFLLPEPFTLPDLQHMYEIVLDRPVEKSAFRKRLAAQEFLEDTGKVRKTGKRPAALYRLRYRDRPVYFPRTFSPRD